MFLLFISSYFYSGDSGERSDPSMFRLRRYESAIVFSRSFLSYVSVEQLSVRRICLESAKVESVALAGYWMCTASGYLHQSK